MTVHFSDTSPASALKSGDLTPAETAAKLLDWSHAKVIMPNSRMIALGVMAGVFIGFGSIFFTALMIEVPLSQGPFRLVGGVGFCMGLLFVCMTGAELSTGNCMILAASANQALPLRKAGRILAWSFAANAVGAVGLAVVMAGTGLLETEHGRVAARIAAAKMALPFGHALVRGILCNALVCLAVWLILTARGLSGKMIGLVLPIAAFVTIGFEHSIANLYMLPAGLLAGADGTFAAVSRNIAAVTIGNLIGGCAVAWALWLAHIRPAQQRTSEDLGPANATLWPVSRHGVGTVKALLRFRANTHN